ncbi:centrosomal protein of 89 kDa [Parasteatoda tepidariorum]|uniref:centrosomal protein of 89 kDa n=1 Tax=Parasteatoda tepidariorum TaxID=114398 RepID=UPI00077FBF73|nr:uncharacterized protein PFB0765w [Parasteatoda tepidariorum]
MEKSSSKFKSPFKSTKYKSFLTLFSPSVSKRSPKLKDSAKSLSSQSINEENLYRKYSTVDAPHYSSESIYSQVESLGGSLHPQIPQKKLDYNASSPSEQVESSFESIAEETKLTTETSHPQDPIYASVKKKHVLTKIQPHDFEIEDLKENNITLKARIKDLSEDNRLLKKKLQDFIKEEKWNEERLHSNLQLKITELETETRKEVKTLSDHIRILMREKEVLNEQIDILQMEKKAQHLKYEELQRKIKSMVLPEIHKKVIVEHQKLINEMKKRHTEEEEKLKEVNKDLEESKNALEKYIKELQNKTVVLEKKVESFEKTNQELEEDKRNLLEQADESKQMEKDMQGMLLSLLKVTENLAIERNVLMRKTSFQDHQHKEIHTSVIDYSLNIGRLQEHISNLYKENHEELMALRTNKSQQDVKLENIYGKQFDILREKIVAQNNRINELENENRKLLSQLELVWQAVCGKNSKLLEDVKAILQNHTYGEKTQF